MSKDAAYFYKCDNCKLTQQVDTNYKLPDSWTYLITNKNSDVMGKTYHLCGKCSEKLFDLLPCLKEQR
jgi:hypothetical protein